MTNQTSSLQPGRPARPILDAFYLPRGLLGRVGGTSWPAACPSSVRLPTCAAPGIELCDLGCGPGVLAGRHPQLRLHLVDPSPVMRSQAARRCRQWQREGRVDISPGTADQIPPADAACDTVISVNTVVMWPDLAAGLREIRRVLRPHGRVVLSWHWATAPSLTRGDSRSPTAAFARSATRYAPASATSRGMISPTPWHGRRKDSRRDGVEDRSISYGTKVLDRVPASAATTVSARGGRKRARRSRREDWRLRRCHAVVRKSRWVPQRRQIPH